MATTLWREPIELSAGDTLAFKRNLTDYLATDGWGLTYDLRGGAQAISFASVADGAAHSMSVPAATTATWLPGEYILAGYAQKGDERHQIYLGSLTITANVPALPGDEPVKTFAQKMVEQLETVMLAKAGDDLAASRVGDSQFQYLTPAELRSERSYWISVRQREIDTERAKAGLAVSTKVKPLFRVLSPGPATGLFGRGSGYGGW